MVAERVEAYVLIQAQMNAVEVASNIRALHGVDFADDVSGPYDVIARVGATDMDTLGKLVVAELQKVDGIKRTLTCPIVRF